MNKPFLLHEPLQTLSESPSPIDPKASLLKEIREVIMCVSPKTAYGSMLVILSAGIEYYSETSVDEWQRIFDDIKRGEIDDMFTLAFDLRKSKNQEDENLDIDTNEGLAEDDTLFSDELCIRAGEIERRILIEMKCEARLKLINWLDEEIEQSYGEKHHMLDAIRWIAHEFATEIDDCREWRILAKRVVNNSLKTVGDLAKELRSKRHLRMYKELHADSSQTRTAQI